MIRYLTFGIFGVGILAGAFVYGVAVGRWELTPFAQVWDIYRTFKPYRQTAVSQFDVDLSEINAGLEEVRVNAAAIRKDLIRKVILPEAYVETTITDVSDTTREIVSTHYGSETRSTLSLAGAGQGRCLQIYIQGHSGDPWQWDYHRELVSLANARGCDFLSMAMFGRAPNSTWITVPTGKYPSETSSFNTARHGNITLYHDQNLPDTDPLALMLSPHYYQIRMLLDDYEDVSIMGISGGGWYSVWMAALLEEIDNAIIYSGSLPMVYRTTGAFFGDHEEYASSVYRDVDYWQLYLLGSYREAAPEERNYYFVFNSLDPCCFMDPSASHFKGISEKLYPDNVKVLIDEYDKHQMRVPVIEAIWREIDTRG